MNCTEVERKVYKHIEYLSFYGAAAAPLLHLKFELPLMVVYEGGHIVFAVQLKRDCLK